MFSGRGIGFLGKSSMKSELTKIKAELEDFEDSYRASYISEFMSREEFFKVWYMDRVPGVVSDDGSKIPDLIDVLKNILSRING